MSLTASIDGSPVTVRRGSASFTQSAEHGNPGTGSITIPDKAGTLVTVGQKDFLAEESDCANTLLFSGFVSDRDIRRGPTTAGTAREIEVALDDINAILGFRGFDDGDGNRKKNDDATVADRLTWLMGTPQVAGLFIDNGRITYPDVKVTKANYRNRFPGDVLADLALAAGGFNWYIRDFGAGAELVFRDDDASTADTSNVRISNVIADVAGDVSGLTFYPFRDFALRRSPARVKSKLAYTWALSTVIEERPATAAAFNGERFGVASNSDIAEAALASREARQMLWELHTEADILEGSILVPAAAVNLINHGDRMSNRFEHLTPEGYGEFSWFRVLEITKKPLLKPAALYEVRLKLSPQEAGNSEICLYDDTPDGSIAPLGGVAGQDISNPSDGIVYYLRGGLGFPDFPEPGFIGRWHFPTWGGAGGADYFASGSGNELRFIVVGNGTLTIQTEQWLGQSQPYTILVNRMVAGNAVGVDFITGVAGEATEVEITTADAPDCVHVVRLRADARIDGSYIGMGWSGATWVGA